MPVYIAAKGLLDGISTIPYAIPLLKLVPWLALLYVLKVYFGGARNTAERNMHGKVVMITGGTSGVGASVAHGLASRGAQLVLLTQHPLSDPFLVDYIEDLRATTNNELITAEHVDLGSLHSIRRFATKWVDNAPPRRLDMLVLCAQTMTPKGAPLEVSEDGVEASFAVNYLSNFHLLSILSPALRAQPADRDVRIIFASCASYMAGALPSQIPAVKSTRTPDGKKQLLAANPAAAYASSKLSLVTFALAFQKHLDVYARPDKAPNNARVLLVDPGWSRTPGMRRHLTWGSLWGLLGYMVLWPGWWLVLKSAEQGAQTFLWAAMEAEFRAGVVKAGDESRSFADAAKAAVDGKEAEKARPGNQVLLLKECQAVPIMGEEAKSEQNQKKLWETSEKAVEILEREGATRRAKEKKENAESSQGHGVSEKRGPAEKQQGSRRSKKAGGDG